MIRFKQSMSLTGLIGFVILNKSVAGKGRLIFSKVVKVQLIYHLSYTILTPKLELS